MTGAVVWFTGLPSSGKSTLARLVGERLRERGVAHATLDGDDLRAAAPWLGFDDESRERLYGLLAALAAQLARQGLVALVPATAHRRAWRARARELAPRFVEVFVATPPEVCARRDAKGLYARARRGDAPHVPGAGVEYEPPDAPEVVARDGMDGAALEEVVARVAGPRRQTSSSSSE